MSGIAGLAPVAERRINIVQGEQHVDNDPGLVLTTILGSCIAACLWDPMAGVGGMNHFLLPGTDADARGGQSGQSGQGGDASVRYGVHAMELLVNALLRRGAARKYLQAKLFGGGRMIQGLTDIGELNASFAEKFLRAEGIAVVGGSLRGQQGRRIQFWPVSGRARQVLLVRETAQIMSAERRTAPRAHENAGAFELF
jgi:chemotaxis protein CheD